MSRHVVFLFIENRFEIFLRNLFNKFKRNVRKQISFFAQLKWIMKHEVDFLM